jgi:DNA-binding Xre family transcriptional regulator
MNHGTIVKSTRDGTTGIVLGTHRDLPEDPLQICVRWHDGQISWQTEPTLEVIQEALVPERTEEDAVLLTATLATVARNLVRIRNSMGMSQRAFAPHIGLTRAHLAGLEVGRRDMSLSVFVSICLHLNVNPNDLLELKLRAEAE